MDNKDQYNDMEHITPPAVVCVVGPTAGGKTALSVALAKALDGEVISCDSMQIYDRLQIGTARPTEEEMQGIPHHLLGFADPRQPFSCADYVPLCKAKIDEVLGRGKLPILCGGTGLYLDSVLSGTRFSEGERDPAVADALWRQYEEQGIDPIYARLSKLDPVSAAAIHKNNTKRVIRALEIYLTTGKTKSEWDALSHPTPAPYRALRIGLDYRDRSVLHDRINRRVTLMLEKGLLEEVRSLCDAGYLPEGSTAAQAIGYKEFLSVLRGESTQDAAADRVRAATRQYAKRQLTWFRRSPDTLWLYPDTYPKDGMLDALTRDALAEIRERL